MTRRSSRFAGAIRIGATDLRATFVTLSLANGRTETCVADRTGHKSSQMINRYRRQARQAVELSLGKLLPLDEAIPELRDSPTTALELWAIQDLNLKPTD